MTKTIREALILVLVVSLAADLVALSGVFANSNPAPIVDVIFVVSMTLFAMVLFDIGDR